MILNYMNIYVKLEIIKNPNYNLNQHIIKMKIIIISKIIKNNYYKNRQKDLHLKNQVTI